MNIITTQIILLTVVLFLSTLVMGQQKPVKLTGVVIENTTKQPLPYVTVTIKSNSSQKIITGAVTDEDGNFSFSTHARDFYVEVSFIGFTTKIIKAFSILDGKVDLGTIELTEDSHSLEEIVVQAERSSTEFKLDKRVFNIGKDLSNTGASALEVLNNVPSVNVDIEGAISLRGSTGVQILINGKPSVIATEQGNALGTITANMMEKVEVITNPSAKYDAEGTSGIINIVLKKEKRKGINGSITFNTGVPHNHSVGLSLNRRTEKFNLFSQLGIGYRELPRYNKNINTNLLNSTSVFSEGTEYRNETFYNFILGTDYHINERNVLTLSGRFAYEVESQPSQTDFSYEDSTKTLTSEWYRKESTEALNPKYQYELQYKSDFEDHEDHTLLFSALGNFFGKDQSSEFQNVTVGGTDENSEQETHTNFKEIRQTLKLDYTRPFANVFTFETGGQYVLQDVSNDYSVSNLVNNKWIQDLRLTNVFEYNQNVLGVYGTAAYEENKFGLKIGLRLENTDLKTLLVTTKEDNHRNFTNLFPSVHTSYQLTKHFSLQGGYSRRIYRPRLWDLNPFFNIRNSFSIRAGNPDLRPEFTNSYEISSIYIVGNISLNLSVYHHNTQDIIERISIFENNVNTFKPFNIGKKRTLGTEFSAKYNPSKSVTISGDINYNYFNREGKLESTSFDFIADRWTTKWTTKVKFLFKMDFETTLRYLSGYQTVQGNVSDQFFVNAGLRKKLIKNRLVINVSVRDIFASRIRESETHQPNFYVYSRGFRGTFVTLGLSYGFGKGEAMEFSSGRRRF